MARKEKQRTETVFHNVKVPETVWQECLGEVSDRAELLCLAFCELSGEGVKISFSFKEAQNSYSVAVTLPDKENDYLVHSASFWSVDLWEALSFAYIATFVFKADKYGWEIAKEAMEKRQKAILKELAEYRATRPK